MNLRDLEYLVTLADLGQFGRAAVACGVSQPTLSAQIMKLERDLGCTLFESRRRGLRPTPRGERVVAQARRVLAEAAALRAMAAGEVENTVSRLRLGFETTLGGGILDWTIPALERAFPEAQITLREADEARLLAGIVSREIDAALAPMPGADPRFAAEPLFDEQLVAVLPPGHGLAARQEIDPRDLAQGRVVLPPGSLREIAIAACGMTGAEIEAAGEAANIETLRRMVAAGLGASLIPALAAPAEEGGVIVRTCNPAPKRRVALVWRREFPQADRLRRLADGIRENLPRGVKPVARRAGN